MESGTIEQTLPGLEGTGGVAPQLAVGRAVSLTPQKRLAVVAGSSHPLLAEKIAGHLGVDLTRVERSTFADGSPYFRFEDSVRGADMFIVQTAAPSIGENLMELLIMVNAAKLASAKRITAVIPWYFYARQDKKYRPREPITARLVADLLETAGVDRVITMDLHAGQVQGFFRIPVDHMVAVPMFAQHIRDYLGTEVERVAVAPDTGRAKLAGKFAEMIGGGLVVLNKERPGHNQAKVTGVIGRRRQGRRDDGRHHRHRRHAVRRRRSAPRGRGDARDRLRHARALQRAGAASGSRRAPSRRSSSPTRCRSTS